jgi:peptidoglycan endopeptidase LytE
VLGWGALTVVALLAAFGSGSAAAWWAAAGLLAAATAYLLLLHHVRRAAAEHEFAELRGSADLDLATWTDVRVGVADEAASAPARPVRPAAVAEAWAVARFTVANLAGWALSPVVFLLSLLAHEQPRDAAGQRWLAAIEATQQRLRDRSMRTLAISAATTASVAAAGTVTALAGGGVASASTLRVGNMMPTAVPAGTTYRVVAGDTLGSIAARFGTTVAALASINRISDPNLIYPGQLLVISGGTGTGGSWGAPAGSTYRVQAGDTLGSIAARFGTTVATLASINHLADPNLIYVGEVLSVRGSGGGTGTDPAPVPHPSPPLSSAGEVAAHVALEQVGKPYQWAGAGPYSFDCSGLVQYAWGKAGVYLPHYSVSQYGDTTRISEGQLEPGDLVFYDTGGGAQPGHVTIYVGGGRIVTADSPGTVVRVEAVDWDGTPIGFGRVR